MTVFLPGPCYSEGRLGLRPGHDDSEEVPGGREERTQGQGYSHLHSRVSTKAPLVMKQLLPPIFHFLSYIKKKIWKKFSTFFSTPGNFLTVRDPPIVKNLKIFPNVGFDSSN